MEYRGSDGNFCVLDLKQHFLKIIVCALNPQDLLL